MDSILTLFWRRLFSHGRSSPRLCGARRGVRGDVPPGNHDAAASEWEAALAHLTLLLVGVSRLAAEVVEDLSLVEDQYRERVSLKDVARAVSLSPGHLTTVVRRETGRTVVEWISDRPLGGGGRP